MKKRINPKIEAMRERSLMLENERKNYNRNYSLNEQTDDEIPDDEIPDDEIPDDEVPDDEVPDDEVPDDEVPDDEDWLDDEEPQIVWLSDMSLKLPFEKK